MVGAKRPLGNTEESLIKDNYGLTERGVGDARPFDHTTGAGRVKPHKGFYDDCINVKGNTLLLLVSEVFGGVNGRGIRFLTRLAHMARRLPTLCTSIALGVKCASLSITRAPSRVRRPSGMGASCRSMRRVCVLVRSA
jgi:hypothetical protein